MRAWFDERARPGSYAAVADGLTASPCIGCSHEDEDKNRCMGGPDCRMDCRKEPIYSPKVQGSQDGVVPTLPCKFPGCDELIKHGDHCKAHAKLVYTRRRRWPDRPELWYAPKNQTKAGNARGGQARKRRTE